nr:YodL domain-containing protein [Sedimentibacter sp.]
MADKAANTKNQVKEITDRLEEGVKDLFVGEKYMLYLQTMSRFHRYSTRNTLLIYMQKPDATLVAGYQAWQSKFGRYVKRGEAGIKILAPTPFTIKKEKQKLDPDTRSPILDTDGLPLTEEVEVRIARFKVIPVFDLSQTDGKPLPSLAEDLIGDVTHYELFLDAMRAVSPLPIRFEPLENGTDGICRMGDRISIRTGMSEIQTVSAVIHEITHAKLHDLERLQQEDETAKPKDRRTEEVEAESVSYAVCQYYGIETSGNSFGYLANWSKTRELKELNASLDIIRKTSAELIDSIDENFRMLGKERGIDLTPKKPEMMLPDTGSDNTAPVSEPLPAPEASHSIETEQPAPEMIQSKPEKQYELGYGHMGNGLTVWNRLEEKDGDYVTVAHIADDRTVTFYDKGLPDAAKAKIEETARTTEMSVSAMQDTPVFSVPPIADTPEQNIKAVISSKEPEVPDEPEEDSSLPDSAIGLSERDLFGYNDPSMLPLLKDRALELYDADHTIYMLYPDNTEAMVFERDEITGHDGIFGIEAEEWQVSRKYAEMKNTVQNSEVSKESDLLYGDGDRFGIYQLKGGEELHFHRFTSLEQLKKDGLNVDRANYELVYVAPLSQSDTLDGIFEKFNLHHPADFHGHSLSVSDVVCLQQNGEITSHYVDSYGFKELPTFLGNEKQPELDPVTELAARLDEFAEKFDTYGYRDDVDDREENIRSIARDIENGELSGMTEMLQYAIEEETDAAEATALLKQLTAYEKPKEPEPAAPTVSELEEQVKAGKQISILDLARAVKNESQQSGHKEKPSILAKLQEGKKAALQGTDTQKAPPKRDSEREV